MDGIKGGFNAALEAGKADATKTVKAVQSQVMPQQNNVIAGQQLGSLEDIMNLPNTQQQGSSTSTSQPYGPPPSSSGQHSPSEFSGNTPEERAKVAAARKSLQDLEQEMRKIREEREQKWAQQNQQEEQKKKQMEFMEEQKKKDDPTAQMLKVRKHEGGKATG